jgi:hypothetical protein
VVLQHEQTHFDIGCALAAKGNNALNSSSAKQANKILAAVNRKSKELDKRYDNETNHGCKAAKQADWESDVQDGLPTVTIP